ncbi:MAG: transcriptional repressor [Alphaproteobacteria bacterium]|nr:MAG: transcriptional repressor [Alphaproteobacteria bacterium]
MGTEAQTESQAIRPYAASLELLRKVGLRPTRQRLALAKTLFMEGGHRHVTAEQLHDEVMASGVRVSLATVYNALHQFTENGLLRELVIEPGHVYFDTNVVPHHHFYEAATGRLEDVDAAEVDFSRLPPPPAGMRVKGVHVILYIERDTARAAA